MDEYNKLPVFKFALREDLADDERFLPTRAEPKATGYDVRAAFPDKQPLLLKPFDYAKIPLGVRGFCPDGWWYEIKPRSSTFAKKFCHALYGTVDETYEGELIFACQYIPPVLFNLHKGQKDWGKIPEWYAPSTLDILKIDFGDAVGQLIPIKRQEMTVQKISNEEIELEYKNRNAIRGAGGFGSTGK